MLTIIAWVALERFAAGWPWYVLLLPAFQDLAIAHYIETVTSRKGGAK